MSIQILLCPLLARAADVTVPQAARSDPNAAVTYHRALVPLESVNRKTDYLPMESQEFRRLVIQANEQIGFPRKPQIQSAFYRARFAEDQLIEGFAELNVKHAADKPGIVSLDSENLAIREPRWLESEKNATVGATDDGLVMIVPPGGGTLTFQWTLVGSREPFGACGFDLRVPTCLMNRIEVAAPSDVSLTVVDGLVRNTSLAPRQTRWQCEFGGNSSCRLIITPETRIPPRTSVAYRQDSHYRISLAGSELTTTIDISPSAEAVRHIALDVDAGLKIRSLSCNGVLLSWRTVPGPYAADQIVVFDLPQPLSPSGATLEMSAVAELEFGQSRQLPTVRPKQLMWQESTARVSIDDSISLQRYHLNHGRQIASPAAESNRDGQQTLHVKFLAPTGNIYVVATQAPSRIRVVNGISLDFATESIQAEIRTKFLERPVAWMRLKANVEEGWRIDDVQTNPPGILSDRNVTDEKDGRRVLEIELQTSTANDSLRAGGAQLLIRAHRSLPESGETISQDALTPISYLGTLYDGDSRSLRSTGSKRLRLLGKSTNSFFRGTSVDETNIELIDVRPGNIVYTLTPETANTSVTLQEEEPEFGATTAVDVTVDDTFVTEEFSIRCTPQNTRLDRVLVHLSTERTEPLRWAFTDPSPRDLEAPRRLASEEQEQLDLGTSGETWELVMPELGTQPRTIRAYREFPRDINTSESKFSTALAVLPNAKSQRATITVRSKGTTPFQVRTAPGFEAILVEPSDLEQQGSIIASYRYDPERHAIGATSAVQIVDQSTTINENCWAWNGRMDSYFSPDGSSRHRLSLQIENRGRGFVTLQVPRKSTVRQISIDETAVTYTDDEADSIRVDLPANETDVQLVVDIFSQDSPWGLFNKAVVEFPHLNIPVVDKEWIVWLPKGYVPAFQNRISFPGAGSWSRTLFGRLAQQTPRLDLSAKLRWLTELLTSGDNAHVNALYGSLDDVIESRGDFGQRLTWGTLLTETAGRLVTDAGSDLIVDGTALADYGIHPLTEVTRSLVEDRASPLRSLQAAGLVILQDDNRLILTTNQARALCPEHFAETPWPDVYRLRQGAWASATRNPTLFPTASRWHTEFVGTSSWHRPASSNELAARSSLTAWKGKLLRGPPVANTSTAMGHIHIVDGRIPHVVGWATFIAILAVGWKSRESATLLALAILLAGILAFLAMPLLQPAIWAILGGTILCLFRRQLQNRQDTPPAPAQKSDSTVVRASFEPMSGSMRLPTLILLLCLSSASYADENEIAGPASKFNRVLVPVNEDQEVIGNQVFLPINFYHLLLARSRPKGSAFPWIIHSIDYEAELSAGTTTDAGSLSSLVASLAIETFRPEAQVSLPWDRSVLGKDQFAVQRNGRPVAVDWSDESKGRLSIPIAGLHQFQIQIDPESTHKVEGMDFGLRIPRVPQTSLRLTYPTGVDVEVSTAAGPIRSSAVGRLTCDLGPTDWLRFRWSPTVNSERLVLKGRQLSWLEVFSNQVFLNVQFVIDSPHRLTRGVDVIAGKQLQWLPRPNQHPYARWVRENADSQRLHIEINDTDAERIVIPLRFFVSNANGAGNLKLPELQLRGFDAYEHWLGVSMDENFVLEPSSADESLTVGEFVDAWGAEAFPVVTAFDVSDSASNWNARIELSETKINTEETVDLKIRRGVGELSYEAEIAVNGRGQFQHRLITPENLRVKKVVVRKNEVEVPIRWSRSDGDATHLFLSKPLTGKYTIQLTGEVDGFSSGQHVVPVVWLDGATDANLKMEIFRAPNTRLRLAWFNDFRLSEGRPSLDENELLWRVASLQTNSPAAASASVEIGYNEATIGCKMLTTVRRRVDGWFAQAEFQLEVDQGQIDFLAFDVPSGWGNTYTVEPSLSHQLIDGGDGQQQLRVWLAEPISGSGTLKITGSMDASETPTVPEFVPRDVSELETFLRLPIQSKEETFTWSTSQLRSANVPDGFEPLDNDVQYDERRAVSSGFRAELTLAQPLENLPWVSSSREVIHVIGRTVDYGVVTFHIEPAGLSSTSLIMPPGSRLLDASIAGVPAQLTSMGRDRWSVGLGTTRLPHRLRIAYEIPHGATRERDWVLQPPSLVHSDTGTGRTLWTIMTTSDAERIVRVEGAEHHKLLAYEEFAVAAIRQVFDAPDVKTMDYSNTENKAWFAHWNGYARRRTENVRRLMEGHQQISLTEGIVSVVERRLDGFARQLDIDEENAAIWKDKDDVRPPVMRLASAETIYLVSRLGVNSIRIQSANLSSYDRSLRFVVATMLVLAGAVFAFGGSRVDWLNWLDNHTGHVLIVAGVAWWCLLYPSWLGVVIAAIGALSRYWQPTSRTRVVNDY